MQYINICLNFNFLYVFEYLNHEKYHTDALGKELSNTQVFLN